MSENQFKLNNVFSQVEKDKYCKEPMGTLKKYLKAGSKVGKYDRPCYIFK